MLNEQQISKVWQNMPAAETRALYFLDLAARYTRRRQWITGASFFLSSGAAATIVAKSPSWVPIALALIVAALSAYSMAVSLETKIGVMVKLHSTWNQIALKYEQLWNHTYIDEAETQLGEILRLEDEPSRLATTAAPNDQKLLGK